MGIRPIVVHYRDNGNDGAIVFNDPIKEAVGENATIIQMVENVEDEIGYEANYEKPFKAYQQTLSWRENWEDVPENWRGKIKEIFKEFVP